MWLKYFIVKLLYKLFLIILVSFSISLRTICQNIINTSIGVNIVKSIELKENSSLHFGTMTTPTSDVDVTLTTDNNRIVSSPSNIKLLSDAPVAQVASYTVIGSVQSTYVITLPSSGVITSGSNIINVKNFVSKTNSTGGNNGTLNNNGTDNFNVGATIQLEKDQPIGIYSGSFCVVVNYN